MDQKRINGGGGAQVSRAWWVGITEDDEDENGTNITKKEEEEEKEEEKEKEKERVGVKRHE